MDKKELAFEEWKHVQSVISRKADSETKIRGWLYTILAALIVAYLTKPMNLSSSEFILVASGLIAFFMILEGIQLIEHWRAIRRSEEIENNLREEMKHYDGPTLSEVMIKKTGFIEIWKVVFTNEHNLKHFVFPYLLLFVVLVIL